MGCGASQYPTSAQLEATMGRFSLKPAQVQKLWSQFVKHDIDKSMTLDSREFHTLFKEKPSPFVDHLFAKHEKSSTTRLPFNEFVDIVASFCLNDEDEMVKFAFGAFDVDHNEGIKPDEFRRMIDTLKKTTVDFPKAVDKAVKMFDDNRDGAISFEEFQDLHLRFPALLWPVFRLQFRIQEATLGSSTWKKHLRGLRQTEETKLGPKRCCKYCCLGHAKSAAQIQKERERAEAMRTMRPRANARPRMAGETRKKRKRSKHKSESGISGFGDRKDSESDRKHSDSPGDHKRAPSGSSVVKLGKAGKQKSLRAMKSNKYLDADEDDVKPKSKQLGKSKSSRKLTKGKSSGNLKSAGSRPGSAKGSRPGSAKKGAGAAGSRRTLSLK